MMDEKEYKDKYVNLRILKSIQEFLKGDDEASTALYPIRVPDQLLLQVLKERGAEATDQIIHEIFKKGLTHWSEQLYNDAFGSQKDLEDFIELVKKRTKE